MNKLLFNNTCNSGRLTYLVVKEKDKYIGVCLEFDLVIEAETQQKAKEQIEDYARLWLKNVAKNKLSEELLNKPAPKEYWDIYEKLLEEDKKKILAQSKPSKEVKYSNSTVASFQLPYREASRLVFA